MVLLELSPQITGTGTNKPTWDAIEVDGKLLVDAALDSQVWSANNDGNDKSAESWENSFNGEFVTNGTGCTSC